MLTNWWFIINIYRYCYIKKAKFLIKDNKSHRNKHNIQINTNNIYFIITTEHIGMQIGIKDKNNVQNILMSIRVNITQF